MSRTSAAEIRSFPERRTCCARETPPQAEQRTLHTPPTYARLMRRHATCAGNSVRAVTPLRHVGRATRPWPGLCEPLTRAQRTGGRAVELDAGGLRAAWKLSHQRVGARRAARRAARAPSARPSAAANSGAPAARRAARRAAQVLVPSARPRPRRQRPRPALATLRVACVAPAWERGACAGGAPWRRLVAVACAASQPHAAARAGRRAARLEDRQGARAGGAPGRRRPVPPGGAGRAVAPARVGRRRRRGQAAARAVRALRQRHGSREATARARREGVRPPRRSLLSRRSLTQLAVATAVGAAAPARPAQGEGLLHVDEDRCAARAPCRDARHTLTLAQASAITSRRAGPRLRSVWRSPRSADTDTIRSAWPYAASSSWASAGTSSARCSTGCRRATRPCLCAPSSYAASAPTSAASTPTSRSTPTHKSVRYASECVPAPPSLLQAFQEGFCAAGATCTKLHTNVCQDFKATGKCPRGAKCKLKHPLGKRRRRDAQGAVATKVKQRGEAARGDGESVHIGAEAGAGAAGAGEAGAPPSLLSGSILPSFAAADDSLLSAPL